MWGAVPHHCYRVHSTYPFSLFSFSSISSFWLLVFPSPTLKRRHTWVKQNKTKKKVSRESQTRVCMGTFYANIPVLPHQSVLWCHRIVWCYSAGRSFPLVLSSWLSGPGSCSDEPSWSPHNFSCWPKTSLLAKCNDSSHGKNGELWIAQRLLDVSNNVLRNFIKQIITAIFSPTEVNDLTE